MVSDIFNKTQIIKKLLLILVMVFVSIYNVYPQSEKSNIVQPIRKISFKKEEGKYYFCIEFTKDTKITPRIHVLPNGAKVILSFDKNVTPPKTKKINHNIINGYFFEQFSPSSLIMILSLKESVVFTEKRYTENSIKLGFKIEKKHLIAIDAGHGGKDPGTRCLTGDYEKNITLIMAIELRNILVNSGKYKVVLTRDSDKFISADTRRDKINAINPDILLSLHTDNNNDKNTRGISIYTLPNLDYLKQTGDQYYLQINPESYYKTLSLSRKFSNILARYIPDKCKIKNLPYRFSELKILKIKSPAILIESGNVSNKMDNQLLHFQPFRERIYYAILYSLDRFFEKGK